MGGDFDRLWIGAGMQVRLPLGGGGVLALWVRGRKGWGKWLYGSKDFIGTLCVAGLGWGGGDCVLFGWGFCHVENAKFFIEIQKKISKNIEKGLFKFEILL